MNYHYLCLECEWTGRHTDQHLSDDLPTCPECHSADLEERPNSREEPDDAYAEKRMDEIRAEMAPVWAEQVRREAARVREIARHFDTLYHGLDYFSAAKDIVKVDTDTLPILRMGVRQAR